MKTYIEWIVRNRKAVIIAAVAITLGLSAQLKSLEIVIDPAKLLPQQHPLVATGNLVEKIFGNKYTVAVGVHAKSGDAFTPEILGKVKRITDGILKAPRVNKANVISVSAPKAKNIQGTEEGLEVHPLMAKTPTTRVEIENLKKAMASNPIYSGLVASRDGATLSVVADFNEGPGGFSMIANATQSIAQAEADDTVEIWVTGQPIFSALIETFSARMGYFFPLSLLIIALALYEAFRGRQALVLPLATALLAVIWSLGTLGLSGVPLDPFNATTPILILAVAAGHAVQIMKRYYEEYNLLRHAHPEMDPQEANRRAVVESLTKVGPVMIAAGTIAAGGFFSLVVFDIKTIQTFGVFTGMGILYAMALELSFIPALRASLGAPGERETLRESKATWLDSLARKTAALVLKLREEVLFAAIGVIMISAVGWAMLTVDNSAKGNFYGALPVMKQDDAYNAAMAGTNTAYILVSGAHDDDMKNPATLKGIERLQRELEEDPIVGKTISIADYIKRINMAMNGDKPEFNVIPDSRELIAQYLLLYSTSGDPGDMDNVIDYGYRNANVMVFLKTDSSARVARLIDMVNALKGGLFGPEVTVNIGGGVTNGAALNEVMVREKALNIIQIAAVVFVISSLIFRSPLAGALVLTPLLFTVAVIFGVMGLTGISLQVATSTISAMAVGIGADYVIYLAYRLREELRHGRTTEEAMERTFATAGKAVFLVALAVGSGYSILMLSYGFNIHFWLGSLIALSMASSAVAALTIFPALILWLKPAFIFERAMGAPERGKLPEPAAMTGLALALALSAGVAGAGEITAEEIAAKSFVSGRVADSEADSTFRLINANGQERVRKTTGVTKLMANGTDQMRLVRFVAPPDVKGTSTLMIEHSGGDDDLWIYLPAMKKTRRLVSSSKKESFVGTDFSYGDVIGHKVEDWKHKILREEKVDGVDCHVLESIPATAQVAQDSGYSRRISWARKDNFVTVKGEMYGEDGALLKTISATDVRPVDPEKGKWQPMRMEARNLATGHSTVITFESYKANVGVKETMFTARNLEKE